MRRSILWIVLTSAALPVLADEVVILGELSFPTPGGMGKIIECATGREIVLGIMASTQLFTLFRRYDELSDNGRLPVTVELQGNLARTSNGVAVLELPLVCSLAAGKCKDAVSGSR